MPLRRWWPMSEDIAGAPGLRGLVVDQAGWREFAGDAAAAGGRLLAMWGSGPGVAGPSVQMLALAPPQAWVVTLPLKGADAHYFGLEGIFPAAARMQRAIHDLTGLRSTGADRRPWLRHAAWQADFFPLASAAVPGPPQEPPVDDYAFVRVTGDGVHEIPVGPVHAGIIEPGHFRFSIVGEKVLRLEARLGYVHKGIERRFTELPLLEGHRLAARVSGDSAVACSWAYCQALEAMAGVSLPERGPWLRALALELERLANHLGDLGALGNDAGFAFGLAQFSRLKERLLRAVEQALGQRYLLDFVVPGGTGRDLDASGAEALRHCVEAIAGEVRELREIYDEHAGVRDRFAAAGIVTPALAARLGLVGLAGRASAQATDLRRDLPCVPYDRLAPRICTAEDGDVLARVAVRFDEALESARLIARILLELPDGVHRTGVVPPARESFALGLIEGWRGPVCVALVTDGRGGIVRCHPHDPSWNNWPVLEHAIIGNIVPDFPLINKSFNLSYAGHDL